MKKYLLFGVIVSIITTNAIANQVITSQTYVDNADAQKVNIAQGVGTNNANVGKTLVVNSQGNLELGTVSAGNYVEDSITDGVTNKAPSENAVHDALANKQNTIPATGTNSSTPGSTVVTYTSTAGTIGERGIFDFETGLSNGELVSGHEGDLLTAKEIVPAINNLYDGSPNTVVVRNFRGAPVDERGIYDGSTTYNSSTDADKLVTAAALQSATNNPPQKTVTYKTCTQWSGTPHTDANCLLWNLSDTNVFGYQCSTSADCPEPNYCTCTNHMCNCNFN